MHTVKILAPMMLLLWMALLLQACGIVTREIVPMDTKTAALSSVVKAALINSKNVDAAAIRVSVDSDVVVLSGFVASTDERQAAVEAAKTSSGGASVRDQLELR